VLGDGRVRPAQDEKDQARPPNTIWPCPFWHPPACCSIDAPGTWPD